jgi:exonuclease SbcC
MGAPVVGVLGENGAGKSTLLNAIRYAFTGDFGTTDADGKVKASTYMRDGGKHGTASVTMEFVKDGKQGSITRKITKTTSGRELTWDGRKITSAAEVDSVMQDILNADKRSVMDCVFVKQGHLDDVLFGKQSEREKSFLRMVGCAHLDLVSKAASTQAAILRTDVYDHGPALQDIATLLEQKSSRFRAIMNDLDGCPDNSVRLRHLSQQWQLLVNVEREAGALEAAQHSLTRLGDLAVRQRVLEHEMQQHTDMTKSAQADLEHNRAEVQRLEKLLTDAVAFQIALKGLAAAEEAAKDMPPDNTQALEDLRRQYAETQAKLSAAEQLHARLTRGANYRTGIQRLEQRLAELVSEEADARQAAELAQAKLAEHRADPNQALERMQIDILTRLLSTAADHNLTSCPVCQGDLSHWDRATAAKLIQDLQRKRTEYDADERTFRLEATRTTTDLANLEQTRAITSRELEELKRSLCELGELTGAPDAAEQEKLRLGAALMELTSRGSQSAAEQQRRQNLLRDLQTTQGGFAHWREHADFRELMLLDPDQTRNTLTGVREACNLNKRQLESCATALHNLALQRQQMQEALLRVEQAQAKLSTARAGITFSGTMQDILSQLEAEQAHANKRSELTAVQQEVQRDITELQRRQGDLEDLQRQSTHKLLAAEQMDKLSQAFGREGISKLYLDGIYARLMLVLGPHLTRMDANFTVRKGGGVLDFEFQRTDEPSEWMPQTQLSGGQRVKMAVAFLLALQEIVIPDVGLLVLDEPTTHLDPASREGFRDMLEDLQAVLQRKECQVIVCDHCVEILPALQKKVMLTV